MERRKFTVDVTNANDIKCHIKILQRELEKIEPTDKNLTLSVNTESLSDCMRAMNIIKSYIGQFRASEYGSRNQRLKEQFDACVNIWEADISHLYDDIETDPTPSYYIYAHCEPKTIAVGKDGRTTFGASIGMTHIPFYIGKGIGSRAYDLNRNETHRKVRQRISDFNGDVVITIIKDNLTEKEALINESKLIDIYGLVGKGGKLVNLDEGVKNKERKNIYQEDLKKINTLYKELL